MRLKKLLPPLLGFLGLLTFGVGVVTAQENPEEVAKKYGITFPIAELGGCTDYSSCRTYCEDPINYNQCMDFAKKKGFYKEENIIEEKKSIEKAKSELGCDSSQSCRTFCDQSANYDKCSSFAQKMGVEGGYTENPTEKQFIEKAKEVLGCDSPSSCMTFCDNPANRDKCSEFAQAVGLRGGEQRVGPGGCTSEESCKTFCSDPANFQVCRGFAATTGATFSGPGGCTSEESCREFCKNNPEACRSLAAHAGSQTYKTYCEEFPDRCKDEDTKDFEKFCLQNPEKCRPSEEDWKKTGYNPQEMCNKTPNCKWTNDTCQCGFYDGVYPSPAPGGGDYTYPTCPEGQYLGPGGACTPYEKSQDAWKCHEAGKYWDGTTCRDSAPPGPGGTPSSTGEKYPTLPPGGWSSDPATACAQSGCTWTNNTCQCSGSSDSSGSSGNYSQPSGTYQQEDPATACARGGCNWTGSSCQCPSSGSTSTNGTAPPPSTETQQTQSSSGSYSPPSTESQPPPPGTGETYPSRVQGISTAQGFLQGLWNLLFGR